jgi:hypothetical protein
MNVTSRQSIHAWRNFKLRPWSPMRKDRTLGDEQGQVPLQPAGVMADLLELGHKLAVPAFLANGLPVFSQVI